MRRVRFPSTSATYADAIVRRVHLPVLFVALALVPLAASVAAVAPGWLPVGDDATITMRGRDFLTGEMPLLGMPSAVGEQTGQPVHHPGPLELWWVGVWERGVDIAQAPLVAAALVWAAGTTAALAFARRIGGTALLGLTAVITALLTWSLRGEVPVTPFNVHVIVMPLGAYLLALAAWHQRVRGAGLVAIVLGSWSAQAHLTAVGPVVVAGAVVAGAVLVRRLRADERPPLRVGPVVLGGAVLVLCWIGPIIDVVTNDGGNVRAVLGARADLASEAIGPGTASDIVVRALAFPPVWATAGAHPSELVLSASVAQWLCAAAVVAIGVVGGVRRRRTHPALGLIVAASSAATLVGAVLAARFPGEFLSLLALHNHLWLWPLTAMLWGAAMVTIGLEVRDLAATRSDRVQALVGPVAAGLAVVTLVVVGVASIGEPHRNLTLAQPTYVRALGDQVLDRLDRDGTYRVTISGEFDNFFVEVGLLSYLEDAGLDVVGPERYREAFGDRRVTPGRPLTGDLLIDLSWEADAGGPGELIAEYLPPADLLQTRRDAEDALVGLLDRRPDFLPLLSLASTDEAEVRRWARDDLDGLVIARLVPDGLADAPETDHLLGLRRDPVLFGSVRLASPER